ncbi:S8 family serine peptidase [Nocardia sp. NPDC055002]
MTRIDIALQHAYLVWRTKLGYAERGEGRDSAEVRHRMVSVLVEYTGDPAGIREAGLRMGFDTGRRVSGRIELAALQSLDAVPGVASIRLVTKVKPQLDDSIEAMRVPWRVSPGTFDGQGSEVIIAVIDSGIDIFHESFRNPDNTTRILELWDQTADDHEEEQPQPVPYGRLYTEKDINDALPAGGDFPSIDSMGHGTHVAGIAAGNGRQDDACTSPGTYVGVAPRADLVIVKAAGLEDGDETHGPFDALLWCAAAPERLKEPFKPPKRVVINCSFGTDTGPHDGTDVWDIAVDDVLEPPPPGVAIVAAAGNGGGAEIHEAGTVPADRTRQVWFFLPESSGGVELLDVWYNGDALLTVEIVTPPPDSRSTGPIAPGPQAEKSIDNMNITVTSSGPQSDHNNKRQISITIEPEPDHEVRGGVWQLQFTETTKRAAATWDAWLQTSLPDPSPTFRLPDESDMVPRRRENTISSPGTSRNSITVADYDNGNDRLADSSSRGHANQAGVSAEERKPTIAAPGTAVSAPRSQHDPHANSSCCDQKVISKSGTSFATPHVAGLVALMFEKDRNLTFKQVREHLQQTANVDGIPPDEAPTNVDTGPGVHSHLWGAGKVDGTAALHTVSMRAGGGGGSPEPPFAEDIMLGYTPPDLPSRFGYWRQRFGERPGLMLLTALISAHVDEMLRLINGNRRVAIVWRRNGGHLLVRHMLYRPTTDDVLVPRSIDGYDTTVLIERFTTILERFGSARLRTDLERFREFLIAGPGSDLARLDQTALTYGGGQ